MQVDQAGWHSAKDLVIPENIRLIPQPAYSPELNPVEHIWDELREKYFHNRIFPSLELLIDALCQELNALADDAERLRSLTGFPHLKITILNAYCIRHTLATEMIDQGADVYTVKEFLGHKSLTMTERYIQVYLESLKAKYDAYQAKQQPAPASLTMNAQMEIAPPKDTPDGGWVEQKVGTLYRSPLPDGIGWCEHLAMLDPCPTPPRPIVPPVRSCERRNSTY